MPGENRSFATSAANAAGGMNPSARSTPSGRFLPLSANKGITRHASIVAPQHTSTTKKPSQPIEPISPSFPPS